MKCFYTVISGMGSRRQQVLPIKFNFFMENMKELTLREILAEACCASYSEALLLWSYFFGKRMIPGNIRFFSLLAHYRFIKGIQKERNRQPCSLLFQQVGCNLRENTRNFCIFIKKYRTMPLQSKSEICIFEVNFCNFINLS